MIRKFGKEKSFFKILYPQIRKIARLSLLSVKHIIQDLDDSTFRSFHLFGFDLLVTSDFQVLLLEINSSPAVAADLMAGMTQDLVDFAIDPFYPLSDKDIKGGKSTSDIATAAALEAMKYLTAKQQVASKNASVSIGGGCDDDRDDDEGERGKAEAFTELPDFRRGFDLVYSPSSSDSK